MDSKTDDHGISLPDDSLVDIKALDDDAAIGDFDEKAYHHIQDNVKQEDDSEDDTEQLSEEDIQKRTEILDACRREDIAGLRSLADTSKGFLTDDLRQLAWPILLGSSPQSIPSNGSPEVKEEEDAIERSIGWSDDWRQLPRHREEDQVQLDVNRSFTYYPKNMSESELKQQRSELSSLIVEVLRRHPYLNYFQGFHDICQVFLLVLSPFSPAEAVSRLCLLRIRDFMLPTLAATTAQLQLIPDILARADPVLRKHLTGIEPFYALAGTLTMYAHNIEGYGDIARLFDAFLAREPVFSVYMFAQIVMDRRDEIFEFEEPDMLHVILGRVPAKTDLDGWITRSVALFESCPPEKLRAWRYISTSSALKTSRDNDECGRHQTVEQGHECFEQQAKEMRWMEVQQKVKAVMWAYRRPAKAVGMAVAVGALAVLLRRNPAIIHHMVSYFSR